MGTEFGKKGYFYGFASSQHPFSPTAPSPVGTARRALVSCHVPTLRLGLHGSASRTTFPSLAPKLMRARERNVLNKTSLKTQLTSLSEGNDKL